MKRILFILLILILASINVFAADGPYYVKNGGSDVANGLSDATAWATIGHVNSVSSGWADGTDVYFKCGSTFTDTHLRVYWEGSSGDRTIIGAYYMDGSETVGVSGDKPVFQGTRKQTEIFDDSGVPNAQWAAMVYTVGTSGDRKEYITVQDLNITQSNWDGIKFYYGNYCSVLRCDISYSNYSSITFQACNQDIARGAVGGSKLSEIGYNTSTDDNLIARNFPSVDNGFGMGGTWGKHLWLHHNTITRVNGESLGVYKQYGDSTIEYNTITAWSGAGIYLEASGYNIVRYNDVKHGHGSEHYLKNYGGIYYGGPALYVATETAGTANQILSNQIYGNVVTGGTTGLSISVQDTATDETTWTDNYWYNNTCYDNYNQIKFSGRVLAVINGASSSGNEIRNNIFINSANSNDDLYGTPPSSHMLWSNNEWSSVVHADAQGSGDIYTGTSSEFTDAGSGDFTLLPTSDAIDAGADLSITEDIIGTVIPQGAAPDMGAYEYNLFISGASPTGTGIGIDTDLNWTNPTGTVTVDVYFEEVSVACDLQVGDLVVDDGDVATYEPGTMTVATAYCWRVDVNHAGGTETGTVYEFTTTGGPPPPPTGLATCSYNSLGLTGSYDDQGSTVGE